MKASPGLHQLIRSMSMSEKRYFKIHSSRHVIGDANNYHRLFDAIGALPEYDEGAVREKFKGETFIRHLPSEKNYLFHQVLDSLNAFHRDKTSLSRYTGILTSIEILYNRGLFEQCKKLIRKAKKEGYHLERFSMLLVILRFETLIFIKDEDDVNLNASIDEELRVGEVIRIQTTLMQIAFNIQVKIEKGGLTKTFMQATERELKKHFPRNPAVNSFWAKYYFHSGMSLLYSVQNKQLKRYECYKKIKALMDDAPQFIRDLPNIYHLNTNNLVNVMFLLGKYDEAQVLIRQQRQFLQANGIVRPALARMVFLNTNESELFLYYKTRRTDAGTQLVRAIEQEVKKIEASFSPLLFDLLYMIAVTELTAKNYKAATRWLNRLLNAEYESSFRKELQINARLLFLIVLHETRDLLFETRMNAARRFIANDPQFKTQSKILEVIRLLSGETLSKKNEKLLKRYVGEIRKENRRANEESLNKQFDFAEWIEERIRQLPKRR